MSIKGNRIIVKDGRWVDRETGELVKELTYDEARLCTKCGKIGRVGDAECCVGR